MGKTDTLLNDLLRDFSPAKAADWLRGKFSYFDSSLQGELRVGVNKNEKTYFARAERLGLVTRLAESAKNPGDRPLLVVAVEMTRDLTDRTSRAIQFNLCKRLLKEAAESPGWNLQGFLAQGIFFFYDAEGRFRISLVTGDVKNRRFQFNEARRQSFFVDPSAANNIVRRRLSEQLSTFSAVREAFSVEALTKEFYVKLFDWYSWALNAKMNVSFPNDVTTDDDDRVNLSEALIRLITRLMFIWFVKQKNIVPAALFDVAALKDILKDFDPTSTEQNTYYRAILQNLFFATLNCQPARRRFVDRGMKGRSHQYGVKTCYRYKDELKDPTSFKDDLMAGIPFLNCALFDCLDRAADAKRGTPETLLDGFSETKKRQAHLPNVLFFHPEKGLVTLFNLFEFTVDENNADDSDIALDPELLGKVFENLLGAFNPETQETARKATGSFYTPREIVDYMVAESLRSYLKTKVPSLTTEQLDDLFDRTDAAEKGKVTFDADMTDRLLNALYDCRILDPACGSGAFPMGILHCMVRLFAKLDPGKTKQQLRLLKRYEEDKKRVSDDMTPAEREDYLRTLKEQWEEGNLHADYARKLYIIENCIYGVDIQPIATQISKLRFFISLLCDQLRGNWDPKKENNGLLSLPNLEAKFVCANTLIPLPKVDGGELALIAGDVKALREKLQHNRHRIFGARTATAKARWKNRDLELRDEIRETVKKEVTTPDERVIAANKKEIENYQNERRTVATEKLVLERRIVGGDLFSPGHEEMVTVDANAKKRAELDAKIAHCEKIIACELDKAKPKESSYSSEVEKLAAKVAGWDPYDQNASSDFFDAEWMFNIKDGFDIVIGNPPYGAKLSADESQMFRQTYENKTSETAILFVEKGFNVMKDGGTLSYIIPKPFCFSSNYAQCRDWTESALQEIVDCGKAFDNVKFEAVIVRFKTGEDMRAYRNLVFENQVFRVVGNIPKETKTEFGFYLNGVSEDEIPMARKIRAVENFLTPMVAENSRGGIFQKHVSEEKGAYAVLGGKELERWCVRGEKGYVAKKWVMGDTRAEVKSNAVLVQNIVAHITKPRPNVKIISVPVNEMPDVRIIDTINQLTVKSGYSNKFVSAILNSRLMNWFVYNFVFGKAIRTMHFDNAVTTRIPIPCGSISKQMPIIDLVDEILRRKTKGLATDVQEYEIDRLVYALYGLNEDEIAVVEGRNVETESSETRTGCSRGASSTKCERRVTSAPNPVNDDEYLE